MGPRFDPELGGMAITTSQRHDAWPRCGTIPWNGRSNLVYSPRNDGRSRPPPGYTVPYEMAGHEHPNSRTLHAELGLGLDFTSVFIKPFGDFRELQPKVPQG